MAEIGTKRSGSDVDSTSKVAKTDDSYDDHHLTLRFLVHGKDCPAVIGKGGENIKRLKKDYSIKVSGLKFAIYAKTRVMVLEGKRKDCLGCLNEIMKTCKNGPYAADNLRTMDVEINLLINSDCVGSIIGKGGCQLKYITDETRGHLKAYPGTLPNSNERVVAIGGDTEVIVTSALKMVLDILNKFPPRVPTYYYNPEEAEGELQTDGGGMNQMGMDGGMQNQMGMGGGMQNQMGMGGGMQNQMGSGVGMPNQMGMGGRMPNQMGMGGGMQNRMGSGVGMPKMPNQMGMGGGRPNQMGMGMGRGRPNQMGMGGMQNQMGGNNNMMGQSQMNNNNMAGNNMMGPSRMNNNQMAGNDMTGQAQMQNNQNQMQNPQMQNQLQNGIQNQQAPTTSRGKSSVANILIKDRDDYVGPKFNQDGKPLDFQQVTTKTELIVPSDMASSIIGIKGTNIKMVCDLSGARVDSKNSKGDRTITITGTQEQVQIAEQLMLNCARNGAQSVML